MKSKDNIADPLTKELNLELVAKSSEGIGLKAHQNKIFIVDTQFR